MTPRSIRRAAERKANKLARKAAANLSEAQLAANYENAQLSTGPVTAAGKAKSSLNAVKSGLTGHTVLLPSDDAAQYQSHLESYQSHWQPAGPEEQTLVQSLADTSWRLARIPGLEMAIYAHGRIELEREQEEDAEKQRQQIHEAARPLLLEAQIYLAYQKQIRNLHLQEARLVRRREKETAELRRLQQERLAQECAHEKLREAAQPDRKPLIPEVLPEIGFEYSTTANAARSACHENQPDSLSSCNKHLQAA